MRRPTKPLVIDDVELPVWEDDCYLCGKPLTQREYYRVPSDMWEANHPPICDKCHGPDRPSRRKYCPHCGGKL